MQAIHRTENDGNWYLPRVQNSPKTLMKTHKKVQKISNLAFTLLLVQGRISHKTWLFVCLLAVLGSQGIVVTWTAAIFFP